tara:strand:- start:4247 stop:4426 length:180 start_codon:yes stop_codon:yes gene_type:complete
MKKTKTGLHIDVKGKRIEVYTKKELEKLEQEAQTKLDLLIVFSLSILLLSIGVVIGMSI